jgi:hypothetical protein
MPMPDVVDELGCSIISGVLPSRTAMGALLGSIFERIGSVRRIRSGPF